MSDKKQNTNTPQAKDNQADKLQQQLETVEKELDDTRKLNEENKTKYLRALADYQNLEKRIFEQREDIIKGANKNLIIKLLPFLDNLERAELFIKDKNLKIIKDSFFQILKNEGLKEIEVLGKEYDPYTAEVIDMVEGEKDGEVIEVLRKGYELNGKILRIAQVKVSKKSQNAKVETQNQN